MTNFDELERRTKETRKTPVTILQLQFENAGRMKINCQPNFVDFLQCPQNTYTHTYIQDFSVAHSAIKMPGACISAQIYLLNDRTILRKLKLDKIKKMIKSKSATKIKCT